MTGLAPGYVRLPDDTQLRYAQTPLTEPRRIQLRRVKGWRKPGGAIVVARPSRWGNPFRVLPMPDGNGYRVCGDGRTSWSADDDHPWTRAEAAQFAVDEFSERKFRAGSIAGYDARTQLRGHDLACWCPLNQPCHADVLLELANGYRS